MRTLFCIILVTGAMGLIPAVIANGPKWIDCQSELRGYDLLFPAPLKPVFDRDRVTICVRAKIQERTMMTVTFEPPHETEIRGEELTAVLRQSARHAYTVKRLFLPSLPADADAHLVSEFPSAKRHLTLVTGLTATVDGIRQRLTFTYYRAQISEEEFVASFRLARYHIGFSCVYALCRGRPQE